MDDYDKNSFVTVVPKGADFSLRVAPRFAPQFETNIYECLTSGLIRKNAMSADIFLDIGAHYGYFSLVALEQNKDIRLVLVEPIQENCEALGENLELNAIDQTQYELLHAAASGRDGELSISKAAHSDNSGVYAHPNSTTTESRLIKAITIDTILNDFDSSEKLLIKVDTEGFEYEVIKGAEKSLKRFELCQLLIEINPKMAAASGRSPDQILELLQNYGYISYGLDEINHSILPLTNRLNREKMNSIYESSYYNIFCVKNELAFSVVLFSHSSGLTGAERTLLDIVNGLVSKGTVCNVVTPGDGPLNQRLIESGAGVLKIQERSNDSTQWWWATVPELFDEQFACRFRNQLMYVESELIPALRQFEPNIILSQTIVSPWGAFVANAMKKPFALSICEYGDLDHNLNFYFGFRSSMQALLDAASLVFSVTQDTLAHFLDNLVYSPEDFKSCVLYRGVEIGQSVLEESRTRKPFTRANGRVVVTIFGTVRESKGQLDLVQAAKNIVKEFSDVLFRIVGHFAQTQSPYSDLLRKYIGENGLSKNFELIEFTNDPYPLFIDTDVVVFCSPFEAIGRTLLEAALLGRPFIYPDSGGPKEIFEDRVHGLKYTPGNIQELSAKLREVLVDRNETYTRAAAAYEYVVERFSNAAFVENVFRSLKEESINRNRKQNGINLSSLNAKVNSRVLTEPKYQSTIFYAKGEETFSAERHIFSTLHSFGPFELVFDIAGLNLKTIRFDPIEQYFVEVELYCILLVDANGQETRCDLNNVTGNWQYHEKNRYQFLTTDPQFVLSNIPKEMVVMKFLGAMSKLTQQRTSDIIVSLENEANKAVSLESETNSLRAFSGLVSTLFVDTGNGLTGDQFVSKNISELSGEFEQTFDIGNFENIKALRYDPFERHWGELRLLEVLLTTLNGKKELLDSAGIQTNGQFSKDGNFVFENSDPIVIFFDIPANSTELKIRGLRTIFSSQHLDQQISAYRQETASLQLRLSKIENSRSLKIARQIGAVIRLLRKILRF